MSSSEEMREALVTLLEGNKRVLNRMSNSLDNSVLYAHDTLSQELEIFREMERELKLAVFDHQTEQCIASTMSKLYEFRTQQATRAVEWLKQRQQLETKDTTTQDS